MLIQSVTEKSELMKRLQVVILDCPYDTFADSQTQHFFGKFIDLKLRAFKEAYPKGILPLGSYDFLGTLVMVCEKTDGDLRPIACVKHSTIDRSKQFNLPFELMSLFHSEKEATHRRAVEEIIARATEQKITLEYNSSWAADPTKRRDPHLKPILRELIPFFILQSFREGNKQSMLSATTRFKVDQVMGDIGFRPLSVQGSTLSPIKTWFAHGEEVVVLHLENVSSKGIELMKKYEAFWDQRIYIGRETGEKEAA